MDSETTDRSLSHLVDRDDVVVDPLVNGDVETFNNSENNAVISSPFFTGGLNRTISSPSELTDLRSTVPSFLFQLADNNLKFFSDTSENGGASRPCSDRFRRAFHDIEVFLKHSVPLSNRLAANMQQYDVSEDTPCSGYRSIVCVYDECLIRLLEITREVYRKRNRLFFSHARHARNLEAFVRALRSLDIMLKYLLRLMSCCENGSLFISTQQVKECPSWVDDILKVDQEPFMGRCLGFWMTPAMRNAMIFVCTAMAAYADTYEWTNKPTATTSVDSISSSRSASVVVVNAPDFGALGSLETPPHTEKLPDMGLTTTFWTLLSGGKYALSAEARAKKILSVTRRASIEFTRAFWGLNETLLSRCLQSMMSPAPVVNKLIQIEPQTLSVPLVNVKGSFSADSVNSNSAMLQEHVSTTIDIEPPSAHGPPHPIAVRLISYSARRGQIDSHDKIAIMRDGLKERSKCLIFHLHGGGFVSQSSQTTEVYVNDWAKTFDVPIVSVDYSLAPQFPYPRALQECFFAYCWCLENAHRLGSTAENVVLIGESSGGNLCTALSMMAAERGVRRPDALMSCYAAFMIKYVPSPSRVLNTIDPLLPMGITIRCLTAYAGVKEATLADIVDKDYRHDEAAHAPRNEPAVRLSKAEIVAGDEKAHETLPSSLDRAREGSFSSKSTVEAATSDDSWDVVSSQSTPSGSNSNNNNDKAISGSATSTPDSVFEPDSRPEAASVRQARLMQLMSTDSLRRSLGAARQSLIALSAQVYETSTIMLSTGYDWLSTEMGWNEAPMGSTAASSSSSAWQSNDGGVHSPRGLQSAKRRNVDDTDFKIIPALVWQNIDSAPDDPFMSPLLATDEHLMSLPDRIVMVGAQFDCVLDDTIEFTKRLRALGKNCKFQCAYNMPHGFLTFIGVDSEAYLANEFCKEHIARLLEIKQDVKKNT